MTQANDAFKAKAATYDDHQERVQNVANIANAIIERLALDKNMHLVDFGSGTGLLLERLAPHVNKITAIDISPAMNKVLRSKWDDIVCELEILEGDIIDLAKSDIGPPVDGVVSSMTFHHIEDLKTTLQSLHSTMKENAPLAIADLVTEDGTFHSEDTGIFHHGFAPEAFAKVIASAGFRDIHFENVSVAKKEQGDFPIFLLRARK